MDQVFYWTILIIVSLFEYLFHQKLLKLLMRQGWILPFWHFSLFLVFSIANFVIIKHLFFYLFKFTRQGLTLHCNLISNLFSNSGQCFTHDGPPDLASWVLGLLLWIFTPALKCFLNIAVCILPFSQRE